MKLSTKKITELSDTALNLILKSIPADRCPEKYEDADVERLQTEISREMDINFFLGIIVAAAETFTDKNSPLFLKSIAENSFLVGLETGIKAFYGLRGSHINADSVTAISDGMESCIDHNILQASAQMQENGTVPTLENLAELSCLSYFNGLGLGIKAASDVFANAA